MKTRLAPTPSGFLHLGNVLSFALTTDLAARTNAKVLLRIDDLDRERVKQVYVQDIFDTLDFLEIPWHEGPANPREFDREYSQTHRMHLYRQALQHLQETGGLFACACSRADILRQSKNGAYPGTCRDRTIPYETENTSWRLRTTSEKVLPVNLWESKTIDAELPFSMRDFVVRRKDGLPAYQLASLIDDLYFDVNLVVRGEDLWESTLAQIYLAGVMGQHSFGRNIFHHHRLLKDPGGGKISKSTGSGTDGMVSVRTLRKQGKKRAAVYSLIGSMLGLSRPVTDWRSLAAAVDNN